MIIHTLFALINAPHLYAVFDEPFDDKRLLHLAPLEFHHREDLPRPPSLVATVLSRSTFDLTEVSLSPLPVIAVIEFAFQCLSPEDI
jgi:hypothetical protein